jgi:hypothetical protein
VIETMGNIDQPAPSTAPVKQYKGRGGNRGGPSRQRMAYARNAALAVRDCVDPTVLAEFYLAIVMGRNPTINEVEDEDGSRHVVEYPTNGGIAPTLEQKMRAVEALLNRGWGQPAQMIQLEAELRGQVDHNVGSLTAGAVPASAIYALRDLLNQRRALQPASVVDATATERALPAASGEQAPETAP